MDTDLGKQTEEATKEGMQEGIFNRREPRERRFQKQPRMMRISKEARRKEIQERREFHELQEWEKEVT